MTAPKIISRVATVLIKDVELLNVRSVDWKENSPWVQIPIPNGPMLYQHLIPHQIEGVIVCLDVASLWSCFFTSEIIDEETGEKTVFSTSGDEFEVTLKDISGNEIIFNFWDVRIMTVDPSLIPESNGEVVWTVKFTASRVEKYEES